MNVVFFSINIVLSLLCLCSSEMYGDTYETDCRIKSYVLPTRILWKTTDDAGSVVNERILLENSEGQAGIGRSDICRLKNSRGIQAGLLLDFGKELHGGLQIVTHNTKNLKPVKIRLRFGESVSEAMSEIDGKNGACNDHSIRDYYIDLPWLGAVETGHTGFRFVRIDLVGEETDVEIRSVKATFVRRDLDYYGSFECNDTLLNNIWNTGAYTVYLNMQNYLWDGIKRDRLVWIGDIHPEMMTIANVFGYNDVVPKSLDIIRDNTPLPNWMNGISSYSLWWLIIQRDWYYHTGDIDYLKEQKQYLLALLEHLMTKIDNDGREHLDGMRFLDWPSNGNPAAIDLGLHALTVIAMKYGKELCEILDEHTVADRCTNFLDRLKERGKQLSEEKADITSFTRSPGYKQAASLSYLAGLMDDESANGQFVLKNGSEDFSTFYGFYMLMSLAEGGHVKESLDIIREYWGGMIHLGATTFWEDFDVAWMENAARIDEINVERKVDVHKSYGDYCYKGYRHSFCHGWASGPTPWLSRYVLGVNVVEPGCRKIIIRPDLGDLEWAKGTFPTPEGLVYISHFRQADGKIKTTLKAPRRIKVVLENPVI